MPAELNLLSEFAIYKFFETGFTLISRILGCDFPSHKSGFGQNEVGVLL